MTKNWWLQLRQKKAKGCVVQLQPIHDCESSQDELIPEYKSFKPILNIKNQTKPDPSYRYTPRGRLSLPPKPNMDSSVRKGSQLTQEYQHGLGPPLDPSSQAAQEKYQNKFGDLNQVHVQQNFYVDSGSRDVDFGEINSDVSQELCLRAPLPTYDDIPPTTESNIMTQSTNTSDQCSHQILSGRHSTSINSEVGTERRLTGQLTSPTSQGTNDSFHSPTHVSQQSFKDDRTSDNTQSQQDQIEWDLQFATPRQSVAGQVNAWFLGLRRGVQALHNHTANNNDSNVYQQFSAVEIKANQQSRVAQYQYPKGGSNAIRQTNGNCKYVSQRTNQSNIVPPLELQRLAPQGRLTRQKDQCQQNIQQNYFETINNCNFEQSFEEGQAQAHVKPRHVRTQTAPNLPQFRFNTLKPNIVNQNQERRAAGKPKLGLLSEFIGDKNKLQDYKANESCNRPQQRNKIARHKRWVSFTEMPSACCQNASSGEEQHTQSSLNVGLKAQNLTKQLINTQENRGRFLCSQTSSKRSHNSRLSRVQQAQIRMESPQWSSESQGTSQDIDDISPIIYRSTKLQSINGAYFEQYLPIVETYRYSCDPNMRMLCEVILQQHQQLQKALGRLENLVSNRHACYIA